jgi:hypothetical protein
MARCSICSHQRVREINTDLLTHRRRKEICDLYSVNRECLGQHARKHIPWRDPRAKKAVTLPEKMADLEYELERLQVLAECDIRFDATESIKVITARRSLLELQMRAGGMLDTHKPVKFAQPLGEHKVVFENGRARTVAVTDGDE